MAPKPPLASGAILISSCGKHAEDNAVKNVFGHATVVNNTNTVIDSLDRITDEGYPAVSSGENMTGGRVTPMQAYLGW